MRRDLAALEERRFDLVVIGGGMFGAAAALDAAQRGLDVALIERGDFAGATSAHSFKMIHGGIRYLQHADIPRIRQSAAARAAFLKVAPHLAHPLPIVVPTYGRLGMKSKPALKIGMGLYDLLTIDRNRGIVDPSRRIPPASFLSADEVKALYPGLPRAGLTGAGVFADGQMHNPPRLVLAFIKSAMAKGAAAANYVEARRLLRDGDRVIGVEAHDRLSGANLEIKGRLVLNAAGPYAECLLEGGLGRGLSPKTPFSRDAYFIVARPLIEESRALTVPSQTFDPEARLSRGARHLFLVPWRGVTLVGVWHKVYAGPPDAYEVTEAELSAWIEEINQGYPTLDLKLEDVALASAGLVPFGENDPAAKDLKYGHRSRIVDHAKERGLEGFVTLIGVRYTTGPIEAVEVVDQLLRKLDRGKARSRLTSGPVHGGDIEDFERLVGEIARHGLEPTLARNLAHNHGSRYREVLEPGAPYDALAGTDVLEAEIGHAVRAEMAMTLADVVFRRTELGTRGCLTPTALARAGELMSQAAGWDRLRLERELAFIESRLELARSGRAMLAAELPRAPALAA